MAKPKRSKKSATHRINTHKPNGATAVEVAPEPKTLDLGPIEIPLGEEAEKALRLLAELNDKALHAHARYLEAVERAKALKQKWEAAADELQQKLKIATHKSDLPLFDPQEREADQRAMETAAVEAQAAPVSEIPF